MTKLKLGPIEDDKPVKVTLEMPALLHLALAAHAQILGRGPGQARTHPPPALYSPSAQRILLCEAHGRCRV